jgi:hypothetical protein
MYSQPWGSAQLDGPIPARRLCAVPAWVSPGFQDIADCLPVCLIKPSLLAALGPSNIRPE